MCRSTHRLRLPVILGVLVGLLVPGALVAPRVALATPPGQTAAQAEPVADAAAWEEARRQGPEAVLALARTLGGAALRAAMPDIIAARRQMAVAAPPALPTNLEEASGSPQAQCDIETARRAKAVAAVVDATENNAPALQAPPPATASALMADLTVGAGCTYATIGAAIAAADPGDRLLIEGGVTFTENLTVPKDLTLEGGYAGCASGSSDRTTIDGNASDSVVIVNRAITVTLQNLDITNGNTAWEGGGIRFAWGGGTGTLHLNNVVIHGNFGQWGGGLWVGPDAEVTGEDVDIVSNQATAYGGGVRLFGGRATFVNSLIRNNGSPLGGGLYATLEDGHAPDAHLTNTDVLYNQALTGDGFGGGVYLSEGTLTMVSGAGLIGNDASHGGGAYLLSSTLTLEDEPSWITSNTATGTGGGLFALSSTVNLNGGAQLAGNSAETGGGAYLDDSTFTGRKALILSNTAGLRGGGVYATNGSTFTLGLGPYPCLGVRCSQLSDNVATALYGGGLYVSGNSVADLRNAFVENNSADYGGGLYVYDGATVSIYNSLFAGNDASSGTGDAIRLNLNAAMAGAGNTVAYNDTGGAATGQAIGLTQASSLSLHCSIIWGHGNSIDTAGEDVTFSNIQGGYAGAGNLDVDPLFAAPGSANFHLLAGSPVIDRCAFFTGMNTDFDNEVRPVVRTTPATPYDMGADEFSAPWVGINGSGCLYGTLQQAIAAAATGDSLQAVSGTSFEAVDIYSKDLTITGGYGGDCTTPGAALTVLDATYHSGSVIDVTASTLTLRNLQMTGGNAIGGGLDLLSASVVTLDNARVTGNTGSYAAGVYVSSTSTLTLTNGSRIESNTATGGEGGGARVWGQLTVIDAASVIAGNAAPHGGGLYVPGGVVDLGPATVSGNQATDAAGRGGGVLVTSSGVVTLSGSTIDNNSAYDGAGIHADSAQVHLLSAVIHSNTAVNNGGGVFLANGSLLHASGDTMVGYPGVGWGDNRATNGSGGGLFVHDSSIEFSGSIYNNHAGTSGGGLSASASVITMADAFVGGVGADQANRLGASGNMGAGLYLAGGSQATLENTVVAGNVFETNGYTYGGGLYATEDSHITLTGSSVENHLAQSATDGRGAGIYLNGSTATLDNSQVLGNTAGTVGGGVRLWGESTLSILNGSQIVDNHALSGEGGGIAAGMTPDIDIANSTLRDNTAGTDGGAIFINGGTLDFTGGWTVRENTADRHGGAVAVLGSAVASFRAEDACLVYFNRALGGHGGMVFLGNDTTSRLYATTGHLLYVYANHASEYGGGLYAGSGGYFDIYGQVSFDRNRADSGGAIYLTGGSRVWIDDYVDIRPQFVDNFADNGSGGAIYAQDSPSVRCDGATFGGVDEGNHASMSGGALYLSGSTFRADNCIFQDNESVDHGGAIAAQTSTLDIFATYPALPTAAQLSGAQGEVVDSGVPTYAQCDPGLEECGAPSRTAAGSLRDRLLAAAIAERSSQPDGSSTGTAPQVETEQAGGGQSPDAQVILATACDPGTQWCSLFSGNVADSDADDSGDGGSIYSNDSTMSVAHTYLRHNSAARGGAIYQTGTNASAQVANSLVYGNTVSVALGSGIRRADGEFTVTHVTLAENVGGSGFSGVATEASNTIAWGNGGYSGFAAAPISASCNIDDGGNAGISEDPLFVDPGAGENYRLSSGSPAIDACTVGLSPDLDNVARPRGTGYDMGAYEYVAFVVTPSAGPDGVIVPDTPQAVDPGETVEFLVIPDLGFTAVVGGTCGGTLVGNTYTTDPVIADCTVEAVFTTSAYTVTPSAGTGGSIAPDTPQTVQHGQTAQFTVTPDLGYIAAVGGTCGGTLVGDTYTTDPVIADCTVEATFSNMAMITLVADPPEGGSLFGEGEFQIGQPATVIAMANVGWAFVEWRENGVQVSTNPSYTFTLTGDIVLTAVFEEQPIEAIPATGTLGLLLLLVFVGGAGVLILRRLV